MENDGTKIYPTSVREAISNSLNYLFEFIQAMEEPTDENLSVRLARIEKEIEDLKHTLKERAQES